MEKKQCDGLLSVIVAGIISLIYWHMALTGDTNAIYSVSKLGNIKCYVILVLIFIAAFFVVFAVTEKIKYKTRLSKTAAAVVFVLETACVLYFILLRVGDYVVVPKPMMIMVSLLFIILVGSSIYQQKDKNHYMLLALIGIGAVLWGVAVAGANVFSDVGETSSYNIHHTSAYIDSIYNVMRGLAFQGGLTEQYGHYALFFIPFQFLGLNVQVIGIMMGLMSAVTFILCMVSFCKVVKSQCVCVIVILCGAVAGIWQAFAGIYWQVFPHRLFFPALTIFLVMLFQEKGLNKKRYVIGCVVMMLAVLWNFESGIISALAWALFVMMDYYQKNKITCKNFFTVAAVVLGAVVFSVASSYVIVNIYNLICGGGMMGFKTFIGMLADQSYIDYLEAELGWGNLIYLHKILIFLGCLAMGLLHNKAIGIQEDYKKINVMVTTAVIGLGLMTYYINRSLAGDGIINIFAVMCFGFVVSGIPFNIKEELKKNDISIAHITKIAFGIYAIVAILVCGTVGINWYQALATKYDTGTYDYDEFQEFAEEIDESVPDDAWAKGEGLTAIYMELGWDKQTRDFFYMTAEDQQTMLEHDDLLVIGSFYSAIPAEYTLIEEFTYNGITYGYYQRQG